MDHIEGVGLDDRSFSEDGMFDQIAFLEFGHAVFELQKSGMDLDILSGVIDQRFAHWRGEFDIPGIDIEDEAARILGGAVEVASVGLGEVKALFCTGQGDEG